jgi:predicted  nucleic acid-binding Zn-ribbon protein
MAAAAIAFGMGLGLGWVAERDAMRAAAIGAIAALGTTSAAILQPLLRSPTRRSPYLLPPATGGSAEADSTPFAHAQDLEPFQLVGFEDSPLLLPAGPTAEAIGLPGNAPGAAASVGPRPSPWPVEGAAGGLAELERLQADRDRALIDLANAQDRHQALQTELVQLTRQHEEWGQRCDRRRQDLDTLDRQYQTAQTRYQALAAELESLPALQHQQAALAQQVADLNRTVATTAEQQTALQTAIAAHQQTLRQLQEQTRTHQSQRTQLRAELSALETRKGPLLLDVEQLTQTCDKLREQRDRLLQECARLDGLRQKRSRALTSPNFHTFLLCLWATLFWDERDRSRSAGRSPAAGRSQDPGKD